jgi:dTDP-4-amino-4,6-dideoxygalactose transaminase
MMKIPFARISCDGNEIKYLTEVIESGWLTTAGKTQQLEERFRECVGAEHACAVCSGTAALHLALEALGIGRGDKVVVPSMTFTASAEVIRYLGADPLFVDVDYGRRLVTTDILEQALSANCGVKAFVVVHFGGQVADLLGKKGLLEVCKRSGVKVVEDAAHAFPAYCSPEKNISSQRYRGAKIDDKKDGVKGANSINCEEFRLESTRKKSREKMTFF